MLRMQLSARPENEICEKADGMVGIGGEERRGEVEKKNALRKCRLCPPRSSPGPTSLTNTSDSRNLLVLCSVEESIHSVKAAPS